MRKPTKEQRYEAAKKRFLVDAVRLGYSVKKIEAGLKDIARKYGI